MLTSLSSETGARWISGLLVVLAFSVACDDDQAEHTDPAAGESAANGGGGGSEKPRAGRGGSTAGEDLRPSAGRGGSTAGGDRKPTGGTGGSDEDAGVPAVPKNFEVSLSTGRCFGKCPVYEVTVDQSGKVEFDGHENVAQQGRASKQIPADDARAIYDAVVETHYWQLKEAYSTAADGCVQVATDHPTFNWKVTADDKTKTLKQYLGCKGIPELDKLHAIEALLREKCALSEWIGS
jgi:hypothetical protein